METSVNETEPLPYPILYQDKQLVAIDKPAGILVHPGREPEPKEQIAMKVLRDFLGQHVYPVHRLDRPTSGVLLFALNSDMETLIRAQFEAQTVRKRYLAAVLGRTEANWTCTEPIQKDETEPFRDSQTDFTRLGAGRIGKHDMTLLRAAPLSGRHHQIRRHLLAGGTPIVGDFLYGEVETMEAVAEAIGQPRMMLHAEQLRFWHPVLEQTLTVRAEWPERFAPFVSWAADVE